MDRRKFLNNVCKAVAVSAVVPVALQPAYRESIFPIAVKARRVGMTDTYHKFWIDRAVYIKHCEFYKQKERELSNYMIYGEA